MRVSFASASLRASAIGIAILAGSAGADSLLKNELVPVCAVDPTLGREYVRSILRPSTEEIDAAREAANGMRAEFAKFDAALMELLRRTPDEGLLEAIERDFVRAEDLWPLDLRNSVAAALRPMIGPKTETFAPLLIRASLGDASAETLTRLGEQCAGADDATRLSRLHLLRGDAISALAIEKRWKSESWKWDSRKKVLEDAVASEIGSIAWARLSRDQSSFSLGYENYWFDDGSYSREKLCWRVYDAANNDEVRGAALTEIASLFVTRAVRAEGSQGPKRLLEAASRLSAASTSSSDRCDPVYRLALEFELARDPAQRDQRIAADFFEFVAFEKSLDGAWGDAAACAGSTLRRLGEPKRAIEVLETIVRANTDSGLRYALSGPNERNRAAIELAYCHETLGDFVSAAKWMRSVESFGEVNFHCGPFAGAWDADYQREIARLDEAARAKR